MNSGRHLLGVSFSGFDPGCVKTRSSQGCTELFSQLPSSGRSYQCNWFPHRRNRDGNSTRKLNIGVFTQPGPVADIRPNSIHRAIRIGRRILSINSTEGENRSSSGPPGFSGLAIGPAWPFMTGSGGEHERHRAHARTWLIREHYAASQTSASVTSVQAGDARGFPFSTT